MATTLTIYYVLVILGIGLCCLGAAPQVFHTLDRALQRARLRRAVRNAQAKIAAERRERMAEILRLAYSPKRTQEILDRAEARQKTWEKLFVGPLQPGYRQPVDHKVIWAAKFGDEPTSPTVPNAPGVGQ